MAVACAGQISRYSPGVFLWIVRQHATALRVADRPSADNKYFLSERHDARRDQVARHRLWQQGLDIALRVIALAGWL